MGMSQRTIYELHCDIDTCTSVVTGPDQRVVLDTAFGPQGWKLTTVQRGHGITEVINKCGRHQEAT